MTTVACFGDEPSQVDMTLLRFGFDLPRYFQCARGERIDHRLFVDLPFPGRYDPSQVDTTHLW